MKVKLFYKDKCPRCPAAKELVKDTANVEYYNLGVVDGLAEATYYNVMSTPTIMILDENDNQLKAWYGEVPDKKEYAEWI